MSQPAAHLRGLIIASALAAFSGAVSAWEASIERGILTCSLAPGTAPSTSTDQVGEGRDIECQFRAGSSAPDETYVGTLQFVGKAKQVFEKGAIILVAKAPTSVKVVPGLLHQKYAAGGRSESGSAVGSQVPLVGEHDASIALHPLVQTFDQPTMALGQPSGGTILIMELQLKSAPA
jgi:hypothetical protein